MKYSISFILIVFSLSANAQKWVKKPDLPGGARDAAISFNIGNKCYFGAGSGYKDFSEYDPATNKWTKKANIPGVSSTRAFGIGFTIGEKGYIGMGDDGTDLKKDFWQYDPDSDKWTQKADFPIARDAQGFFVIGDKAYVGGGTNTRYIFSGFYSYDASTDKWDSLGEMPNGATAFAGGFSIGGKGYFVGGAGTSEYSTLYEYDPLAKSLNKWTRLADFPGAARQAGASFAINGKGYFGLGQSGYTTVYKDFYEYDPINDKWTRTADFTGNPLAWPIATVLNGRAFIGGGFDFKPSLFNEWYEFVADTTTGIEYSSQKTINGKSWYNATENKICVKFENASPGLGEVSLFDISGKLICSEPVSIQSGSGVGIITCPHLVNGIYILTVKSDNAFYSNKLFITN